MIISLKVMGAQSVVTSRAENAASVLVGRVGFVPVGSIGLVLVGHLKSPMSA